MQIQLQQVAFVDKLFKKNERENVDKWVNQASAFEIRDFNNLMEILSNYIKADSSSRVSSRPPSRGRILSRSAQSLKPDSGNDDSTQILDLATGTIKIESRPTTAKVASPLNRTRPDKTESRPHSAPTFASAMYRTSNASYVDYSKTTRKVSDDVSFIVRVTAYFHAILTRQFYCASFVEDNMASKLREWYSQASKKDQELLKDVFGRLIRSQKTTSYRDSHRSPSEEVLKNAPVFERRKNSWPSSKAGELATDDAESRLKQLEIIHQHQLEKIRTQQVILDGNKITAASLKEAHEELKITNNPTELPGYASTDGRFAREKMMEGIFTSSIRLGMYPKDEQFKSYYASQYTPTNVSSKRVEEYTVECASGQFHHKTKPF